MAEPSSSDSSHTLTNRSSITTLPLSQLDTSSSDSEQDDRDVLKRRRTVGLKLTWRGLEEVQREERRSEPAHGEEEEVQREARTPIKFHIRRSCQASPPTLPQQRPAVHAPLHPTLRATASPSVLRRLDARSLFGPRPGPAGGRLLTSVPQRLQIPMHGLVRSSPYAMSCVFLGFTKCGRFLISYSSIDFVYKLQLWHFRLGKPLSRAAECTLFRHVDFRSILGQRLLFEGEHFRLTFWESEDDRLLVVTAAEAGQTSRLPRGYHITIVPIAALLDGGACCPCTDYHCAHMSYNVCAPFPRPSPVSLALLGARNHSLAYMLALNTGESVRVITLLASPSAPACCPALHALPPGTPLEQDSVVVPMCSPSSGPTDFNVPPVCTSVFRFIPPSRVTAPPPPAIRAVQERVLPFQRLIRTLHSSPVNDYDARVVCVDTTPLAPFVAGTDFFSGARVTLCLVVDSPRPIARPALIPRKPPAPEPWRPRVTVKRTYGVTSAPAAPVCVSSSKPPQEISPLEPNLRTLFTLVLDCAGGRVECEGSVRVPGGPKLSSQTSQLVTVARVRRGGGSRDAARSVGEWTNEPVLARQSLAALVHPSLPIALVMG